MTLLDRVTCIPRQRHEDHRGWFLKVVHGTEEGLPQATGEVYLTLAKPGEARGHHYHPETDEWFTLVVGKASLRLADPASGERADIALDAASPVTVHIPAGIAHVFVNAADADEDFLLVAYAANLFDPADTIPFEIAA